MDALIYLILLITFLVQLSSPMRPPRREWRCSGPQSKYSYSDCETDYSFSDGCYYVKHFSQFRPCGWICNDIKFNSIDEERCKAFCSGYILKFCQLVTITTTTVATSAITESLTSTTTVNLYHSSSPDGSLPSDAVFMTIVIAGAVVVMLLLAVFFAVCYIILQCKRRRSGVKETFVIPVCETADVEKFECQIPFQPEEFQKPFLVENELNKARGDMEACEVLVEQIQ